MPSDRRNLGHPPRLKTDSAAEAASGREQYWRIRSWTSADAVVARGAIHYRRERDLPRLLPEYRARSLFDGPGPAGIVAMLRMAMLKERALGAANHRAYCIARHMALAAALKAEEEGSAPEA